MKNKACQALTLAFWMWETPNAMSPPSMSLDKGVCRELRAAERRKGGETHCNPCMLYQKEIV
jgi:hypothetical protein